MTHVLTFEASGTARCLYTEQINLNTIGQLEISRASEIEFNNETQQWEVFSPERKLLYTHVSRAMCLHWEHQLFNR
ncbi:MAG: hypothetical protein ABIP71_07095 [Verrucomicrobiota bacterium]